MIRELCFKIFKTVLLSFLKKVFLFFFSEAIDLYSEGDRERERGKERERERERERPTWFNQSSP